MAKLPALVSTVSDVSGVDRKTVDYVARFIREHGYIATTGRGAGASEVSVPEVANLLIAMNAAETTRESISAIDQFRTLKRAPRSWEAEDFKGSRSKWFTAHDFGAFLNELVRDVPSLIDVFEFLNVNYFPDYSLSQCLDMGAVGMELSFSGLTADMTIFMTDGKGHVPQVFRQFTVDIDLYMQGFYKSRTAAMRKSDRKVTVTITHKTLIALHGLLFPELPITALENSSTP